MHYYWHRRWRLFNVSGIHLMYWAEDYHRVFVVMWSYFMENVMHIIINMVLTEACSAAGSGNDCNSRSCFSSLFLVHIYSIEWRVSVKLLWNWLIYNGNQPVLLHIIVVIFHKRNDTHIKKQAYLNKDLFFCYGGCYHCCVKKCIDRDNWIRDFKIALFCQTIKRNVNVCTPRAFVNSVFDRFLFIERYAWLTNHRILNLLIDEPSYQHVQINEKKNRVAIKWIQHIILPYSITTISCALKSNSKSKC